LVESRARRRTGAAVRGRQVENRCLSIRGTLFPTAGDTRGRLAIGSFYEMLEWLNGRRSRLETNDCALHGPDRIDRASDFVPEPNHTYVRGRLGVFYRNLG
jgi:hypothetical protein